MSDTNKATGRLLVFVAAIGWSTAGFFGKAPIFEDWPLEQRGLLLAFWRAAFASIVLVPMVRKPSWSPKLIPMVTAFVIMNVTYLCAVVWTTASNAIWLQNTAPIWILLVGVFFLGEAATRRDYGMVVFSMLGVGFILFHEVQGNSIVGSVTGLVSATFYATVVLSLRVLRDHQSSWLIALNHVATAIVLLPYLIYQGIYPSMTQCMYLAMFGIFQLGLPYVLFARGLKHISGHEASGIVLIEPILVPLWVYLAWHNSPNYQPTAWWTFVGGGFILLGLALKFVRLNPKHAK